MRLLVLLIVAAGAIAVAPGAYAFEEQRAGGTPKAGEVQPVAPKADYSTATGAEKPKADAGTVVRIPGIGKLGVLPKLDFGLELLYGANRTQPDVTPEVTQDADDGDLRIRGSVKHRF